MTGPCCIRLVDADSRDAARAAVGVAERGSLVLILLPGVDDSTITNGPRTGDRAVGIARSEPTGPVLPMETADRPLALVSPSHRVRRDETLDQAHGAQWVIKLRVPLCAPALQVVRASETP